MNECEQITNGHNRIRKANIRKAAFETNSSSSHSITIADGAYIPDTLSVVDGVCEIHPGEFGWGVDDFYDAATKASYCLTYLKGHGESKRLTEMFVNVVKQATGASDVRCVGSGGEYYAWGYIDHQSDGVCGEAFASEDALAQFIFNPESRLHICNDNSSCAECEAKWND